MSSLDDLVLTVVRNFVSNGELFTALDVSNKVKETMPLARHREIRDIVRTNFHSEIEVNSYARTPIVVTLADGSTAEALLYHPLASSWDLETIYDAQKRSASATRPGSNATTVVAAPAVSVTPVVPVVSQPTPVVAPPSLSPRQQWANLFNTQPSLFQKK